MQKRFAVIGWGSLIWDLDTLAPYVAEPWQMSAGPQLPMEFSRVSPKRKMGLAVCLDPVVGEGCDTHVIASVRSDLGRVIEDLAERERAPVHHIGGVCLETGEKIGRPEIAHKVAEWSAAAGWVGAVWTDLPPNYLEMRGESFSITNAVAYLKGLNGESLDEAVRYISNAPAQTDTPLRRELSKLDWWQREACRIRTAATSSGNL